MLSGENGVRTIELDVRGSPISESLIKPPKRGNDLLLSVDARLSEALYGFLMERIRAAPFEGGAAAIMDVSNGEIDQILSTFKFTDQKKSAYCEPKFKVDVSVGDLVRITDGPFKEMEGRVEEVDEERGKIKVLVSLFGRETPVELDPLQTKKL